MWTRRETEFNLKKTAVITNCENVQYNVLHNHCCCNVWRENFSNVDLLRRNIIKCGIILPKMQKHILFNTHRLQITSFLIAKILCLNQLTSLASMSTWGLLAIRYSKSNVTFAIRCHEWWIPLEFVNNLPMSRNIYGWSRPIWNPMAYLTNGKLSISSQFRRADGLYC